MVGKFTPIHFNPQIAVLVDPYNRDNEYGPIGLVEDQFDEIAQNIWQCLISSVPIDTNMYPGQT